MEAHDSAMGGHLGFHVTYARVKRTFSWPGMKKSVREFVAACGVCKQAKPEHVRYPGLLQPLPIPEQAWQIVSLNFVEGLPRSRRFNSILVVVDKLTQYAHLLPLSHSFTAIQVTQAYIDNVYKLHGLPQALISDRDCVFTSKLWKELFRLAGSQLRMSTAYHPQTDGQTERVNQCLEAYLHCYVHACPAKWSLWLPLAKFWYNSSYHSALGKSPFEVLYGHPPRRFGITDAMVAKVPELDSWLRERAVMTQLLRQHLERSRQRMKDKADKKRTERVFAVGNWVYLKIQPYVQTSVGVRTNQKLAFRYYGPFQVVATVGAVSYCLALPVGSQIHPVFHVSLLCQAAPPSDSTPITLPVELAASPLQVPEKILAHRDDKHGSSSVHQVRCGSLICRRS